MKTKREVPAETRIEQEPYEETPHKQKMRELASAVGLEIMLPSLYVWAKDFWPGLPIEFQSGKYHLPIGVAEVVEIDKNNQVIKVKYYDIGGVFASHLVRGLLSHLDTSKFSRFAELAGDKGKLKDWVGGVGQYSEALLTLLKLISDEVKGHKAKINYHDEAKPGVTSWFIITAWNDAIQKASGCFSIGDSWYQPPLYIPGIGLWELRGGNYGLGLARSKRTILTYEKWHKELRAIYAENELAKEIADKTKKLNDTAAEIGQRLHEFSDMERLPGHCELC